jgi:hypothetical protein
MTLCRALAIVACGWLAVTTPAAAQFQPPQQAPAAGQEPPCMKEFARLRDDARKKAGFIEAAGKRESKPTAQEACKLFTNFSAAENKLIKYAAENSVWCGIPQQVIDSMKSQQAKTIQVKAQACKAAAAPQRPRGPTLSDALGAPVPNANNVKPGRGTFDTLTGSPLTR